MQPAPKPIRVLLVDDHRIMLWALERLIESEKPRMEVVGKATSVAEAFDLAGKSRPDVILLGLDLGAENGGGGRDTGVDRQVKSQGVGADGPARSFHPR